MTIGPQINLPRSQLVSIRERIDQGEAVNNVARELGVSFFGLRACLQRANLYPDFSTRPPVKRIKAELAPEQERGYSELSQRFLKMRLL